LNVRPKKHLGQHFLKDENIARKIVGQLSAGCKNLLEIGPGTGILTKHLLEAGFENFYSIDTDHEAVAYLHDAYPGHRERIIKDDFLKIDLKRLFSSEYCIIGNFPYNISSQIFFRVLENRNSVQEVVCMIQREVAERIISGPGTKKYGILSVLLQAFYNIELCFYVSEKVFHPPPRVQSAVIRLTRNERTSLDCDEGLFFEVVRKGFNQRRKILRNSLKSFSFKNPGDPFLQELLPKRPEQLGVEEFEKLTLFIEPGDGDYSRFLPG
jgi:16S rRNA (adenine1518-N6/adenine1519-N6)-dimethyltransferase